MNVSWVFIQLLVNGLHQMAYCSYFKSCWEASGNICKISQMPEWESFYQLEFVFSTFSMWADQIKVDIRKTSLTPVIQRYFAGRTWVTESQVCVCVCVTGKQYQSDAGWAAGGPVFNRWAGGRGQARESHGSQPPAGSVDQLQGCSLSGDGRKKGREGRAGTQTSEREVVCSGARGRGLDDASYGPL